MRRSERLAEARHRVAQPGALGLELGEPRLELIRHVVERDAEQRELVVAADGDALRKLPRAIPWAASATRRRFRTIDRPSKYATTPTSAREASRPRSSRFLVRVLAASMSGCGVRTANRAWVSPGSPGVASAR